MFHLDFNRLNPPQMGNNHPGPGAQQPGYQPSRGGGNMNLYPSIPEDKSMVMYSYSPTSKLMMGQGGPGTGGPTSNQNNNSRQEDIYTYGKENSIYTNTKPTGYPVSSGSTSGNNSLIMLSEQEQPSVQGGPPKSSQNYHRRSSSKNSPTRRDSQQQFQLPPPPIPKTINNNDGGNETQSGGGVSNNIYASRAHSRSRNNSGSCWGVNGGGSIGNDNPDVVQTLKAKLKEYEKRLEDFEKLEERCEQYDVLIQKYQLFRGNIEKLVEENQKLNELLEDRNSQFNIVKERLVSLERQTCNLENQRDIEYAESKQAWQKEIHELFLAKMEQEQRNLQLKGQLDNLQKDHSIMVDRLKCEINSLQAEAASLREEKSDLGDIIRQINHREEQLKSEKAKLGERLQMQEDDNSKIMNEVLNLRRANSDLTARLREKDETIDQLGSELREKSDAQRLAGEQLRDVNAKLALAQKELVEARQKNSEIEAENREHRTEIASLTIRFKDIELMINNAETNSSGINATSQLLTGGMSVNNVKEMIERVLVDRGELRHRAGTYEKELGFLNGKYLDLFKCLEEANHNLRELDLIRKENEILRSKLRANNNSTSLQRGLLHTSNEKSNSNSISQAQAKAVCMSFGPSLSPYQVRQQRHSLEQQASAMKNVRSYVSNNEQENVRPFDGGVMEYADYMESGPQQQIELEDRVSELQNENHELRRVNASHAQEIENLKLRFNMLEIPQPVPKEVNGSGNKLRELETSLRDIRDLMARAEQEKRTMESQFIAPAMKSTNKSMMNTSNTSMINNSTNNISGYMNNNNAIADPDKQFYQKQLEMKAKEIEHLTRMVGEYRDKYSFMGDKMMHPGF